MLAGGLQPRVISSAATASMNPSWVLPSSSVNVPPGTSGLAAAGAVMVASIAPAARSSEYLLTLRMRIGALLRPCPYPIAQSAVALHKIGTSAGPFDPASYTDLADSLEGARRSV